MAQRLFSGSLLILATGGIWFVFAGDGSHSHCGPCWGCRVSTSDATIASASDPNLSVMQEPARLAWIRYDEPPIARNLLRNLQNTNPNEGLRQVGHSEPKQGVEIAPMPESLDLPKSPRLATSKDRY